MSEGDHPDVAFDDRGFQPSVDVVLRSGANVHNDASSQADFRRLKRIVFGFNQGRYFHI
ncbi:hypothetical protein [Tateyamaria pelophila]|uniref:hypothetical protein n=1 Tax=Tateyamaria pelophila TaxID=328415 RepID=UPI001CBCF6BE|nr:hypothetical protein [Tateyamaria pelophila]